jgi:ATP-binding cassette, subfamily B (MDR/TAP), member 1
MQFRYSSSYDKFLILIGCLGAIGSGVPVPLWTVVFGDIIDVYIEYEKVVQSNFTLNSTLTTEKFLSECLFVGSTIVAMGVAFFICSCILVVFLNIAATNQTHRIKIMFFRSILTQEIAWFDTRSAGDFASRVTA